MKFDCSFKITEIRIAKGTTCVSFWIFVFNLFCDIRSLLMKVDCFRSEIIQRVIEFAKVDVSSLLKVFVSIFFWDPADDDICLLLYNHREIYMQYRGLYMHYTLCLCHLLLWLLSIRSRSTLRLLENETFVEDASCIPCLPSLAECD